MYKLIAVDLDGTLLSSRKQISKRNADVILKTQNHGINVAICTGRFLATAAAYAMDCGARYVIAYNGALIYNVIAEKCLYQAALDTSRSLKAIDILDSSDVPYNIFTSDKLYIKRSQLECNYYFLNNPELPERLRAEYTVLDDLRNVLCKNNVLKIEVYSHDIEIIKKARASIDMLQGIDTTSSGMDSFDIIAKGVCKGSALGILAGMMNISREEIAAIGDNENDYSMLKYAGLSIAMCNGTAEVKSISDCITASNDGDGVAQAIERYIIKVNILHLF